LYPFVGQSDSCRGGPHLTRKVKSTITQVAPVAHRTVHLQDVGQAVAEEVDQLQIWMGQGVGGQVPALQRGEVSSRRLESGVIELERRKPCGEGHHRSDGNVEVCTVCARGIDDEFVRWSNTVSSLEMLPCIRCSADRVHTGVAAIARPDTHPPSSHAHPGARNRLRRPRVIRQEGLYQSVLLTARDYMDHLCSATGEVRIHEFCFRRGIVIVPYRPVRGSRRAAPPCPRHWGRRAVRMSGREIGITEQVARLAGCLSAVNSPFHANLMQEGDLVEREILRSERLLVQVSQIIGTDQVITLGVRANFNACAALRGADLKPRAVVGERIRAICVKKSRFRHGFDILFLIH
jgi:hypothetical protein